MKTVIKMLVAPVVLMLYFSGVEKEQTRLFFFTVLFAKSPRVRQMKTLERQGQLREDPKLLRGFPFGFLRLNLQKEDETYTCIHIYIYTVIYIYIYMYIYAHIYTYIYIHHMYISYIYIYIIHISIMFIHTHIYIYIHIIYMYPLHIVGDDFNNANSESSIEDAGRLRIVDCHHYGWRWFRRCTQT